MSATHASDNASAPNWRGLLAIGIGRLREIGAFGWYFVLTIGLSIVTEYLRYKGAVGGFASAALGLVNLYALFILTRQLMTGQLAPARADISNAARLLLISVGLSFVLALVAVPVIILVPRETVVQLLAALSLLVPVLVYFIIRTAFYIPALALNDTISLRESLRQTAPYWKALTIIFVAISAGGYLMHLLLEQLGLPRLLQSFVEGVISAAGAILMLAPVCYLYWRHVRGNV